MGFYDGKHLEIICELDAMLRQLSSPTFTYKQLPFKYFVAYLLQTIQ